MNDNGLTIWLSLVAISINLCTLVSAWRFNRRHRAQMRELRERMDALRTRSAELERIVG